MADLEDLLVKGDDLDRALVAGVLGPLLRIDSGNCAIRPQGGWRKVNNPARILAYLLARKAMVALGLPLEKEGATPSEVTAATGIPQGSVNPSLIRLYEDRPQLVDKDDSSRYSVPSWAIDVACNYISAQTKPS